MMTFLAGDTSKVTNMDAMCPAPTGTICDQVMILGKKFWGGDPLSGPHGDNFKFDQKGLKCGQPIYINRF